MKINPNNDVIITEDNIGEYTIICKFSGKPLTRVNDYGMFCDVNPCRCEEKSKQISKFFEDILDS